ncbi:hypothetical protein [Myxococcus landrumensis]|uniref:Lipoprotein n=1 Tax=Myxococcus landrumensis TaxID=2813577 RepID=A0ABX7N340_9BACT|nr:hypothetical protein [Myxococcus landrumus]QSQ12913.1 hypothetical protein JY572_31875 [Myxococcus landrumus]
MAQAPSAHAIEMMFLLVPMGMGLAVGMRARMQWLARVKAAAPEGAAQVATAPYPVRVTVLMFLLGLGVMLTASGHQAAVTRAWLQSLPVPFEPTVWRVFALSWVAAFFCGHAGGSLYRRAPHAE